MPRSRSRMDWRPILMEACLVILGVVLALAANEWRKAQLDRQGAETALQSIREELRSNRDAVYTSALYHLGLSDTLSVLARRDRPSSPGALPERPDVRLFSQGFFHPAMLLHTAWDAAAAKDAVRHMDHADVLRMARVYEQQERYLRQSEQVGQLIYTHLFSQGYDGVARNYANLGAILGTFWYRECQLLHRYDEVLGELGAEATGDPQPVPERCRLVPPR